MEHFSQFDENIMYRKYSHLYWKLSCRVLSDSRLPLNNKKYKMLVNRLAGIDRE